MFMNSYELLIFYSTMILLQYFIDHGNKRNFTWDTQWECIAYMYTPTGLPTCSYLGLHGFISCFEI